MNPDFKYVWFNFYLLILQLYLWQFGNTTSYFPGGSDSKESACNTGDSGSFAGSGRSSGEGNGYPLHYSCLENSVDREAWWAEIHGVAKSPTWLIDFNTFTLSLSHWTVNLTLLILSHFPRFWHTQYLVFSWCVCAWPCLALCDPMNCSLPGSSVHGISQARILEWVAIFSSRGSSWPSTQNYTSWISWISRQILYHCTTWEAQYLIVRYL